MPAHIFATAQYGRDHIVRQNVDRHADQRQRENRLAAHCIDVGQRIGRGNAAEVVRIVDDRHEKVGGGDNGLLVVQAVDGCIVGGFRADQQVGKGRQRHAALEQVGEDAGRNLAATAAAVRETREARHSWIRSNVIGHGRSGRCYQVCVEDGRQ
jgi:hypothetical protein